MVRAASRRWTICKNVDYGLPMGEHLGYILGECMAVLLGSVSEHPDASEYSGPTY